VAIALLVVGGLFLGVPKPGVHLVPGDLFHAEHPHHWSKTAPDWADEKGLVDLEVEIEGDAELEAHHAFTFLAEAGEPENMPEEPVYAWTFKVDDEITYEAETAVEQIEYTFEEEGDLTIEVLVSDGATGQAVAGSVYNHTEKSAFPITNTMITSWITVVVLVLLAYFGMRKRQLVPAGLQNFIEVVVEWFLNFVENAAGRENGRRFFPVVATIFFFVIMNAYLALIPVFNVIGWGHEVNYDTAFFGEQSGFVVTTTLFRSANTDVNLPLALAIVSFIAVEFWGFSALGFRHYLGKFIKIGPLMHGFKGLLKGKVMDLMIAVIEAFVGFIELILEFMRMVSFTFRLFGNMTAGEVLLMMMAFLIPLLVAVPFYGLELLVGFIQGLVFAGLTLGFAMIAVAPHEEEHE